MPKREPSVTDEQIETAMDWLDVNNGEEGEAEACKAVIAFLQKELDRRRDRRVAIAVAKSHGISLARAYTALRLTKAKQKTVVANAELTKAFKDLGVKE